MQIRTPETDREAIRAIVEAWVIWRDGAMWEHLLSAWHPGGLMSSTRFDGTAQDFVAQTRAAYANGSARVRHTLGGFWCDVRQDRAISISGMGIHLRAHVHGIEVDVTCQGRFVDFWSFRNGRWAMDRRQPIYDRDRIDPVMPGTIVELEHALLESFPKAYRHVAYVQRHLGQQINCTLPQGDGGPSYDTLMQEIEAWTCGGTVAKTFIGTPQRPIRRIVTGESEAGLSTTLRDETELPSRVPVPGLRTTLIWATAECPDPRAPLEAMPIPRGIAPRPGGSRFSVLDIAPGHRSKELHRTDTIDYVLCLAGRIDMLLDDEAVTLAAGDIAIQRGTHHGWYNRWSEDARVAVVLLDSGIRRDGAIHGGEEAP